MNAFNLALRALVLIGLTVFTQQVFAAAKTCTSVRSGDWASKSTWDCNQIPTSSDIVIIVSPHTVTLGTNKNSSFVAASLTVNSGATLNDTQGNDLTVSGNITNNGTISSNKGAKIYAIGNSAVASGIGTYSTDIRLYFSGTSPSIAAGSTLMFSGKSRLYAGEDANGIVSNSVLTINGTIDGSGLSIDMNILRLSASNTIVGSTGVIKAGTAIIEFKNAGTLTNNGTVTVGTVTVKSSGTWTNAANSSLTVNTSFMATTLNASATGNTVTWVVPAVPFTPSNNTYYNLAGSAVSCPTSFTVQGSSPCVTVVGSGSVTSSPTSCVSVSNASSRSNLSFKGVVGGAWSLPNNALSTDTTYAIAPNLIHGNVTEYLQCTGFNFSTVPAGATISGITVYVTRKTNGGTMRDAYVYLLKAGTILTGWNGATMTKYGKTDTLETHGSSTSLWNTTWTDADLKLSTFGVAFAAQNANTGSTKQRTVSVDHVQIRVDYGSSTVDHVSISTPTVGETCSVFNVNISAHTAAHTAPTSAAGTIRVTSSDGVGTWSIVTGSGTLTSLGSGSAKYAYGTGETNVILGLSHSSAGTVTIAVADNATGNSLLAQTPVTELQNTITFSAGGFAIADSAGTILSSANLTQIAGTTSPTYYLKASCSTAFKGKTKNVEMAFECIDPVSCQTPVISITNTSTNVSLNLAQGSRLGDTPTYSSVSLNFDSNSLAPFNLNYPDVGNIRLYFRYTANSLFTAGVPFVVKPAGFVLTNVQRSSDSLANPAAANATGAAFVKAGEAFSVTVTAVNSAGNATPNFGQEAIPENVKLSPTLVAGLGLVNTATLYGTLGAFSNGAAAGSNFSWNEVGIITLTPSIADQDYLGAGDVTGTPSANIGRFTLGKFSLQNKVLENRADVCQDGLLVSDGVTPCPAMTYMDEEMDASFTLVPMSINNVVLQNYIGSATASLNFGKFNPLVFASLNMAARDGTATILTNRLSVSTMPAISCLDTPCFLNSQAEVTVPFKITRGTSPDGVYATTKIGLAPTDEGATVDFDMNADATAGNDHGLLATTEIRYGRSRIVNVVGSELLPLSVPLTVQYWNGSRYVTSADDYLSPLSILLTNTNAWTTLLTQPTLTAGIGKIGLSAPGRNNTGFVTLNVTSPSYLPQAAEGRATFGVYKGRKEFIYFRERY